MATKAAKQENVQTLSLKFDGGLNYAQAPSNIKDNELTRALNIIYNSQTGTPETRSGSSKQTAAACDSTNPILKGYYYEKSTTEKWHVAVCNGNLYYLSGASLNAWTKIGALNDTTTVPSFLTYNAKLLIADGGLNIKTWDGTTFSSLADGLYATALAEIKGRVVANSKTSADLVTLSGPYNETYWNTSTEGAVALRAGYGDNMTVQGFSIFGDNLIIFKKGDSDKKIYRLDVSDATTTNWYVAQLTGNNTMQNAHCAVAAFNNVYFVDTNGFKSLKGVSDYGDIQVEMAGSNINTLFGTSTCDEVSYLPLYTSIWCLISNQIYCFQRIADVDAEGSPIIKNAFTNIVFMQGRIRSVYQAGNSVYLCGHDGYLYKMDTTVSTDDGDTYTSVLKGKQFSLMSQGILRKTQLYLSPLKEGTAILKVITPEKPSGITLNTITLLNEGTLISAMTDEIASYTGSIYSLGAVADYKTSYNRARGSTIQFEITTTSGGVGFEGLKADIALVGV